MKVGSFLVPSLFLCASTAAADAAPLVRRSSDGSTQPLDAVVSYPLGVDDSETFQEASVELERGDAVLLYTDGITDARGAPDDAFGRERVTHMIRESRGGPADLIDRLCAAAAHGRGRPEPDDQTPVAARIVLGGAPCIARRRTIGAA